MRLLGPASLVAFGSLLAAAACSAFGGSDSSSSSSSGADAAAPSDASVAATLDGVAPISPEASTADAGRCNPAAPFGSPYAVNGAPTVIGAFRLTKDEQHAYYDDSQGGLFYAPLLAPDSIGTPTKLAVASPDIGGPASVSLSDDETIAFFEQNFKVWQATGKPGGPYGGAAKVLDSAGQPYLDEHEGAFYYSHYFPSDAGTYPRTIYKTTYANKMLGAGFMDLNLGPDSNFSPTPGALGEGLYVGIDRGSVMHQDIFLRAPSMTLTKADVLDSASNEYPVFVSRDGCYLYLGTNRHTGYANELFVAKRGK